MPEIFNLNRPTASRSRRPQFRAVETRLALDEHPLHVTQI
jgi:hypothetical protein